MCRVYLPLLLMLGGHAVGQDSPPAREFDPSAYIYLEAKQARYELLFPLEDVESFYPNSAGSDGIWEPEEQDAHADALQALLESFAEVRINGKAAAPESTTVVFLDLRAPMTEEPRKRPSYSTSTGAVGLILTYRPPSSAYQLDAAFHGFDGVHRSLPVQTFSGAEGSTRVLTPGQNRLLLAHSPDDQDVRADGSVPAIPIEKTEEGAAALESMLTNVYTAFRYGSDEEIYDALARTVTGDLLPRIYLDIRGSLFQEQEGGAVARVQALAVTDARILHSGDSPRILATWEVAGTLEHWGHVHARTNRYSAEFSLVAEDGSWRLSRMQLQRQERVSDDFSQRESGS